MTSTQSFQLSNKDPFSMGGNRLCFVCPVNPDRCLKVHRPNKVPSLLRKKRKFPANLRSLECFDENIQEANVLADYWRYYPEFASYHLSQSFGMHPTDLGLAHMTDLIRDHNGQISETVEQYLWSNGNDDYLASAIAAFKDSWLRIPPPNRDLLPHNLLIRKSSERGSIVIIDGLGRSCRRRVPKWIARHKAEHKLAKFDHRIKMVLRRRNQGESPKARLAYLERNF